jgi:4-amino-4-deoxy-L-arabinose transferase-like glycosyltransferase
MNEPSVQLPPPRWTWPEIAGFWAILLVAALLRFDRISAHSFWTDELFTVQAVNGTGLSGTFGLPLNVVLNPAPTPTRMAPAQPWWCTLRVDGHENNPPLFYLLTRAWVSLFGYSERSFRAHAAVWSLAVVVLLYILIRRRTSAVAPALWAAAMTALAEQHIQLAQNARSYPMLLALCLLAALALTAIEQRGASTSRSAMLALALFLGLLTHYTALGVVIALIAYALLCFRGAQRRAIVMACIMAVGAFTVLWGRAIWIQHNVQGFVDPQIFVDDGPGHIARTLWRFALLPSIFLGQPPSGWDTVAAVRVILVPIALAAANGVGRRRDAILWSLWFAGATLPPLGADLVNGSLRLDIPRFTILASPAIYALVSTLTVALRPVLRHVLPAAAVLSCALTTHLAYDHTALPDWRRVATKIAGVAKTGDLIVIAPDTSDPDLSHMWAMLATHYLHPIPGPLMILTAPHDVPKLWPSFAAYHGVVIITSDADHDGIFPHVTPTAIAYDYQIGQIYRFDPNAAHVP